MLFPLKIDPSPSDVAVLHSQCKNQKDERRYGGGKEERKEEANRKRERGARKGKV